MAEVSAGNVIDFSRIRQKSVCKLLNKNSLRTLADLSKLVSYCYHPSDGKTYHKHLRSFLIEASVEKVWNTYKTIPPADTWNGRMVSFGMMYSRRQNQLTFPEDDYTGIEAGQLIFLNLNLFANLLHLAVGHEITGVFEDSKHIKICYVQNGASVGTQLIQLKKISDTQTEVLHETWYTSGSWLRDKLLYPVFHARAITEFHLNVKRKAETV